MDFIDYYKILEINKKATPDDIKKAYRKLARKFHPDLNPNNADAKLSFQKINEANSCTERSGETSAIRPVWKGLAAYSDEFEKAKQRQSSGHRSTRTCQSPGDFSDFCEAITTSQLILFK